MKNSRQFKFKQFLALLLVTLTVLVGCNSTRSNIPEDTQQKEILTIDYADGPVFETDPYENVDKTEFYNNYSPAVSASDAYYRTQHGLMSGDLSDQSPEPEVAEYRPQIDGKYVRNTSAQYSSDGTTYYVLDSNGNLVNKIYKDGAYITLEEVSAYVMAFGDVPANYEEGKKVSPKKSIWGEYLRLNHSAFSGSTYSYPYEPELPNISGCGGTYQYYELDIGTTGVASAYQKAQEYNNGSYITRGSARIVYARYDRNNNGILEVNEKYVFYTYNHYNDFTEYLNYSGGWGETFGNVTGGGTHDSKTDYNPTPYVETLRDDFSAPTLTYTSSGTSNGEIYFAVILPIFDADKARSYATA